MLLFNRDENKGREALPLDFWTEINQYVIGGLDVKSQGSWLALNTKTMNLSFLTNYAEAAYVPFTDTKYCRGNLVKSFATLDYSVETIDEMPTKLTTFLENKNKFKG